MLKWLFREDPTPRREPIEPVLIAPRRSEAVHPPAPPPIVQPSPPPIVQPSPPPTAPLPRRGIDPGLVAMAGMQPAQPNVFNIPPLPNPIPGVAPSGASMAQDRDLSSVYDYSMNNGMITEGLTFLGYPYLAELSQRPEYRKIVEIVAQEMTRKWIKLYSTAKDDPNNARIDLMMDAMDKFKVRDTFKLVAELDGFFGRAHIFLDTGYGLGDEELEKVLITSPAKIGINGLKRLVVIEPMWAYPGGYNAMDPTHQDFYRPSFWYVQSKKVHRSRMLTLVSMPVPDMLKPMYSFGGLPRTQVAKPYVDNWLRTRTAVADLVDSFSTSGIMTNLDSVLAGDANDHILRRVDLFNKVKDNRGTMLLDRDSEQFFNVSTPLGTLDKLQAQAQEQMASVSGIPLVKLLGITPSGLNASSDGEIRVFYDLVLATQEYFFRPALRRILDVIQLSEYGNIDPTIDFSFIPLWEMDEAQKSTIRQTNAATAEGMIQSGIIDAEEERERLAHEEGGLYNGLDLSKVIESPAAEEPPGEGDDPDGGDGGGDGVDGPGDPTAGQDDPIGDAALPGEDIISQDALPFSSKEWDEAKVKRSSDGKFASTSGGSKLTGISSIIKMALHPDTAKSEQTKKYLQGHHIKIDAALASHDPHAKLKGLKDKLPINNYNNKMHYYLEHLIKEHAPKQESELENFKLDPAPTSKAQELYDKGSMDPDIADQFKNVETKLTDVADSIASNIIKEKLHTVYHLTETDPPQVLYIKPLAGDSFVVKAFNAALSEHQEYIIGETLDFEDEKFHELKEPEPEESLKLTLPDSVHVSPKTKESLEKAQIKVADLPSHQFTSAWSHLEDLTPNSPYISNPHTPAQMAVNEYLADLKADNGKDDIYPPEEGQALVQGSHQVKDNDSLKWGMSNYKSLTGAGYGHEDALGHLITNQQEALAGYTPEQIKGSSTDMQGVTTIPGEAPNTGVSAPKPTLSDKAKAIKQGILDNLDKVLEKNKPSLTGALEQFDWAIESAQNGNLTPLMAQQPIANPVGMAQKAANDYLEQAKQDLGITAPPVASAPEVNLTPVQTQVAAKLNAIAHKKSHQVHYLEDAHGNEVAALLKTDTKAIPEGFYGKINAVIGEDKGHAGKSSEKLTKLDPVLEQYAQHTRGQLENKHLKAIGDYQNGSYSDVNHYLNTGSTKHSSKEETEKTIATISEAIQKAPPIPADLAMYRGLHCHLKALTGFTDPAQAVGRCFVHKNFASTTRSLSKAKTFSGGNTLMKFSLPAGAKGVLMKEQSWERELLLDKASMWRIDKVESDNDDHKTVVHCTYLGHKHDE